jgi:hypothetical protein
VARKHTCWANTIVVLLCYDARIADCKNSSTEPFGNDRALGRPDVGGGGAGRNVFFFFIIIGPSGRPALGAGLYSVLIKDAKRPGRDIVCASTLQVALASAGQLGCLQAS